MCGGVLVPAYMRAGRVVYWRRTCFVEERGIAAVLAGVVYANGARPLQTSQDHYLPSSRWPEDGRLHDVHLYCQNVQGGKIRFTQLTPEQHSQRGRAGAAASPFTTEQRVRGGRAAVAARTSEQRSRLSSGGGRALAASLTAEQRSQLSYTRNHIRWHINREVVNGRCDLCTP